MSYRIINILLWPVWFIVTLRIAWREKDWRYFKQRLGYAFPTHTDTPLWIHCASVGEVNTWLPLHHVLLQQYPTLQCVITTTTPTGARMLAKHALPNTRHVYLPIDTVSAVTRFIHHTRPRLALVMETELWPELYWQCKKNTIPLVIVNARLSHKTLDANGWIKKLYARALQGVSQVLCRSQTDADAYMQLGANKKIVQVVGNLKFSALPHVPYQAVSQFTNRQYVLAASTHADEELQITRMWKSLSNTNKLLVIAPRHPQRCAAILSQLAPLGMHIAVRSRGDEITATTQVYLADTLGELLALMSQAVVVVMGGSLVPRGGQNLLEPARLGKAIIVGPYMFNFAVETELFLKHQACLQVKDIKELSVALQACLVDNNMCLELGRNAQQLMRDQSDMAARYLTLLNQYYADLLSA